MAFGDILEGPDDVELVPWLVGAMTGGAYPHRTAFLAAQTTFAGDGLSQAQLFVKGEAVLVVIAQRRIEHQRGVADHFAFVIAEDFAKLAIAAADDAVMHEDHAHRDVVENHLLLGQCGTHAFVGVLACGDVLEHPRRALIGILAVKGACRDAQPGALSGRAGELTLILIVATIRECRIEGRHGVQVVGFRGEQALQGLTDALLAGTAEELQIMLIATQHPVAAQHGNADKRGVKDGFQLMCGAGQCLAHGAFGADVADDPDGAIAWRGGVHRLGRGATPEGRAVLAAIADFILEGPAGV